MLMILGFQAFQCHISHLMNEVLLAKGWLSPYAEMNYMVFRIGVQMVPPCG
jgi:hypothetical protein